MHHSKRRTIRSGTCSSDRQGPRRPYMTTKRDRMMQTTAQPLAMIRTNIPFRLDRLPWSRFHLLVVIGLGITWILDGLEVTSSVHWGQPCRAPTRSICPARTLEPSRPSTLWAPSLERLSSAG
jgi:hypothetical protein